MQVQTLPEVFQHRPQGNTWSPVPSVLMASEPTTEVVAGKQVVTYKINPAAVWSDGQPITSEDIKYTAFQVRDGNDIADKTGYSLITSVATPDPQTAVVTLKTPYVNWKDLFSGFVSVLPSHILAGKNRGTVMKSGYSFSGGPWKIESWQQGASVTLVPNDKYWGPKPKLDKVTFQFTTNTSAAFLAYKSGQLDSIYPSPQLDAINQVKNGIPGSRVTLGLDTANKEALWVNNGAFPFDDVTFRQAFSYAIDRTALVNRLYGSLGVKSPAQTFWPGTRAEFGGTSFSTYSLDLEKVKSLMSSAGWTPGSDGIWEKNGQRANFTLTSLSGDTRRLLAGQIIQEQLKAAGFQMEINNITPTQMFTDVMPRGKFQASLWTLIATDPTSAFAESSIPTKANDYAGINFMRVDVPALSSLFAKVDSTIDPGQRAVYSKQADDVMAENAVSLPLDNVPSILLTKDKIGGPISTNPVEGPWWNLNEWGLVN